MELDNIIEDFKDNLVIYTLLTYGLGLVCNYAFYSYFGIPIFNYITLQEMLLFAVSNIVQIILVCFVYELLFLNIFGKLIHKAVNFFSKTNESLLSTYRFFTHHFTNVLIFIPFLIMHYVNIGIGWTLVFSISIILVSWRSAMLANTDSNKSYPKYHSIFLVVTYCIYLSFHSASIYADKKQAHKISFEYSDGQLFTSVNNEDVIFIGETSSHIFLYNVKCSNSSVITKSEIKNLVYIK